MRPLHSTIIPRPVVPLGRFARSLLYPVLAKQYRRNPAAASALALRLLGIADLSYRPDFLALANAVDQTCHLDSALIECGVFRGSTLLGMAHRLRIRGIRDANLIGCDSFQGFPAPTQEDALRDGSFHEIAQEGVFHETSYEGVTSRISALGYAPNIRLLKGFFANSLPQLSRMTFKVVHLDCDLYQSYVTCLHFFYPRLVQGGYMVFDEYDFSAPAYPGAKKAIDGFLRDKPEKLQRLQDLADARPFLVKL
jgi:Macrocin-O-methyltransferase (TylF)